MQIAGSLSGKKVLEFLTVPYHFDADTSMFSFKKQSSAMRTVNIKLIYYENQCR